MSIIHKAQKNIQTNSPAESNGKGVQPPTTSLGEPSLLEKVKHHLQEGQPQKALGLIKGGKQLSEDLINIRAVCL